MSAPRIHRLRSDDMEVEFLPDLGGRVHRIRAFGEDLLRTPDAVVAHRRDPFLWGAYPMAPWCNRAPAGRSTLAGRDVNLPSNFPDGSAIHGLVSSRAWSLREDGTLAVEVEGSDAWPWAFEVTLVPALVDACLALDYRLRNRSNEPMPAGIGLHPWFRTPLTTRLPADEVYATNTGSDELPLPVGGPFDLRRMGPPAAGLDATWTSFAGPAVASLAWAGLGISLEIETWVPGAPVLVALAAPRELGAVAIEPQTHGPDGMRRLERSEPDALTLIGPGASLHLEVRLTAARDAAYR